MNAIDQNVDLNIDQSVDPLKSTPTEDSVRPSLLGMWIFLATEILLFSMLFFTFGLYRHLYPADFSLGTNHLNLVIGTINTAVLLTSSFTMVLAVHQKGSSKIPFLATLALGALFLVLKAYEYLAHYHEGLFPILNWQPPAGSPHLLLFFFLYFFMTGLHALHLLIGLVLVSMATAHGRKKQDFLENIGLYWHFVDVVWIFLFPALYLIGRSK
jgi:cytochrome c oxidase subunit 3